MEAEADRREGRRIPPAANNPRAVLYREAVDFGEQLQRYFDALGRERVHVIIFDDFKADTAAAVRDTFRFLEVDDAFQPTLEIVNPAKVARLRMVQRMLSSPPGWLRRGVRGVLPRPTRKRIYRGVSRLNARAAGARAHGAGAPQPARCRAAAGDRAARGDARP